jgi:hypothetical protein
VEVRVLSWAPSLTRTSDGFPNIKAAVKTAAFFMPARNELLNEQSERLADAGKNLARFALTTLAVVL